MRYLTPGTHWNAARSVLSSTTAAEFARDDIGAASTKISAIGYGTLIKVNCNFAFTHLDRHLKSNFVFVDPIRFSGPNLRWLGYVICHYAHRLNLQTPDQGRPLIVLDYDDDDSHKVGVIVLDLDRTPFPGTYFTNKYSARVPKLEDVWRLCDTTCSKFPEPPHHSSRKSIPVLALLPRGWQKHQDIRISQALAAILIVETSLVGVDLVTSQYVKWLHCT